MKPELCLLIGPQAPSSVVIGQQTAASRGYDVIEDPVGRKFLSSFSEFS